MIYLELFWSFIQIGLFTIGGGYASLPLLKYQAVEFHQWITLTEFVDIITIAESTPGPIAINSATFVGVKVAGIFGGIIATFGAITPSIIIVLILAALYSKYKNLEIVKSVLKSLRPVVVALIASAAVVIIKLAFFIDYSFDIYDIIAVCLFILSLFLLKKFKLNPIWIMLGNGVIGGIIYLLI